MAAAVEEASASRMKVGVVVGEAMVATSAGRWVVGFDGMEDVVQGEVWRFVGCCGSRFMGMFQSLWRATSPLSWLLMRCVCRRVCSGGLSVGAGVRGMENMDHNVVCRKEGVVICLSGFEMDTRDSIAQGWTRCLAT